MLRVTVSKDGAPLQRADFRKDEIIIGRGSEADVHIPAEAVSRRHARLTKTEGGWQVSDVGAANGVYVSHERGEPQRVVIEPIARGDRIHIEHFVIEIDEVDELSAMVADAPDAELDENGELATKRTQFISMVDVLRAREAIEAEKQRTQTEPITTPQPDPVADDVWWVRLASPNGHLRTFPMSKTHAKVGAGAMCDVKLPNGPAFIVELERMGPSVTLRRQGMWPFPRVHVDGRAVRDALLEDREGFTVGDFEVQVLLRP